MAQFVVQNLEDDIHRRLCEIAKSKGQSVEDFVRELLQKIANERQTPEEHLGTRISRRFSKIGLDQPLEPPPRQTIEPLDFDQ